VWMWMRAGVVEMMGEGDDVIVACLGMGGDICASGWTGWYRFVGVFNGD
jgi:hypothetical protein